jgi:hypothetical protein
MTHLLSSALRLYDVIGSCLSDLLPTSIAARRGAK